MSTICHRMLGLCIIEVVEAQISYCEKVFKICISSWSIYHSQERKLFTASREKQAQCITPHCLEYGVSHLSFSMLSNQEFHSFFLIRCKIHWLIQYRQLLTQRWLGMEGMEGQWQKIFHPNLQKQIQYFNLQKQIFRSHV